MSSLRRILVFDVNETMLDVNALEPHFARVFGDGRVLRDWFSTVLLYSNVVTVAGPYADFGAIGGAALDMVAAARGVTPCAAATMSSAAPPIAPKSAYGPATVTTLE